MTVTPKIPLRYVLRPREAVGRPDLPVLSVYRDHGVVPKDSRTDNFNKTPADLSRYQVVRPGDLVVNKMKAWQGSLAVSRHLGIVSPDYLVCEASPSMHSRYLHFALRSAPLIAKYRMLSKGIRPSQWRLYWEDLATIQIEVPAASEQRRVADFLDRETARAEAALVARARQLNLVRERFDSSLVDAFFPGETQPAWHRTRLKYLFRFERNGVWGNEPSGGAEDVLCVRVADFDRLSLRTGADAGTIRSVPASQYATRALKAGDVLLEKSGGGESSPVGFAVSYDGPGRAVCSNFVAVLRPASGNDPRFLALLMAALYKARRNLPFVKQTTGIQNLDSAGYLSQEVWVPAGIEQAAIARECEAQLSTVQHAVAVMGRQYDLLHERGQALVTAAVTGKIDATTARGMDV